MWLSSEGFQQCRYKAGFADAGLAGKQNYLAFAVLCTVSATHFW
jgi:hypothetical protein